MFLTAIKKNIDLNNPQKKVILTQNYINPGILKRNLALEYGSIANLSVLPLREFVLNHSISFFNDKKNFSPDNHFWAFYSILNELRPKLKYFYEAVEFESLTIKILSLIEDLKLNNISEREIYLLGKESDNLRKWEEIIFIKKAYQKYKIKNDLYDFADAIKQLIDNKIEFENTYIIDFKKSILEEVLIKNSGISSIKLDDEIDYKYKLSGYKVDTSNQEVQQTIRNIKKDFETTEPPVRIGICVPDYDTAYYKFKTHLAKDNQSELIHYGKGIPFFDTSPGKFFAYLKDWVTNDFTISNLLKLLMSGYVNNNCFGDYEYKDYLTALSYFRNSNILLFDENFEDAFYAYLEGKLIKDDDDELESLIPNAVLIAKNITAKFQFLVSDDSLQDKLIKLNDLFNQLIHTSNKNDNVSLIRIQNFTEDFINSGSIENPEFNLLDFLSFTTEHLNNIHIGVTLPDYTKPILGTVRDLVYYHLDKLYVLGLNEIGLPKKLFQNPLILDFEIDLLSKINSQAKILRTIDRQMENDALFQNLRSIVKKELVLSAPLKDLSSGREYLVSRYMLDEWERYFNTRMKEINYKTISGDLSENESSKNNFVCKNPSESFYLFEAAVSLGMNNINNNWINFENEQFFPAAESLRKYIENHKKGGFNEYWGFLDLPRERKLPVFSSSRLTSWVNCPYQYFLKYELKLNKKDEFDAFDLEWLDILSYGSFLHELYFNFFMSLRERNGSVINKVEVGDSPLFDEEFNILVEKYKQLYPVKSEIHFELQYSQLRQVANQFFENELLNKNTRKYFELSFGMSNKEGRDTTLCLEEPAEIKLNDGSLLEVRGSIDRVDLTADNNYLLIDYKTGKPKTRKPSAPFDGGKFIQAGIYPLIVEQIVKEISNPSFEYYYTNNEYGVEKLSFGSLDKEHFKELLTSIIKQIRKGNFVPSGSDPRYGMCPYCDFNEECLKGRKLMVKQKSSSDENYNNYKNIIKEKLNEVI